MYSFEDVLDKGLTIEDWFKNLWSRDKNSKSLLGVVEKTMEQYKNDHAYSRDILESMKVLRRKLISQAKAGSRISPEFIEALDIDFDPAIYDTEDEEDYYKEFARPREEVTPNIDKLVDESNRRYTMEEFNDIYEDLNAQQTALRNQKTKDPIAKKNNAIQMKLRNDRIRNLISKKKVPSNMNQAQLDKLTDEQLAGLENT
jgi:hypothetical protein